MKRTNIKKKTNKCALIMLLTIVTVCLFLICGNIACSKNVDDSDYLTEFKQVINKTIESERMYVLTENKETLSEEELENIEYETYSETYYAKKGESYDFYVNGYNNHSSELGIFDSVAYVTNGNHKVKILDSNTISQFKKYFQNFRAEEWVENKIINPNRLLSALKEHEPSKISYKDNKYELTYGDDFYKSIIIGLYQNINNKSTNKVSISVIDGKIIEVHMTFNLVENKYDASLGYLRLYNVNYEFKFSFDYQKTVTPNERQQKFSYGFYKKVSPTVATNFTPSSIIGEGLFVGQKLYYATTENASVGGGIVLGYYDVKTEEKKEMVTLPVGVDASKLILIEDALYFPDNAKNQFVKYDVVNNSITYYDMGGTDRKIIGKIGDTFLIQAINQIYKTRDFVSFNKAEDYSAYKNENNVFDIKYVNGYLYASKLDSSNNTKQIVKITDNGESQKKITIGYDDEWYFNSKGIIISSSNELETYNFKQYDWDLNYVKEYNVIVPGDFYEETEDYLFFNYYVYDKNKDLYYDLTYPMVDLHTAIDGVFYWTWSNEIYSSDKIYLKSIDRS